MDEAVELTIGARVTCEDGECGELQRVVVDQDRDAVTHLVVEPGRRRGNGRLVPIDLVEATTAEEVRLGCTLAQFDALDHAEVTEVRTELRVDFESQADRALALRRLGSARDLDPDGLGGADADGARTGLRTTRRGFTEDNLPDGEGEIARGQHVHASDGPIGHVRGLVAGPGEHELTYVLLEEGHLWGEREVAIPVSAVKFVVTDGVYLNLTKKQVGDLPPADLTRLTGPTAGLGEAPEAPA